jgi:hypothetical protein
MFLPQDIEQFKSLSISIKTIERQLNYFQTGFPFINLDRPAVPGDGILQFGEKEKNRFIGIFNAEKAKTRILKFVPASGAASRMFKSLFEFREHFDGKKVNIDNDLRDRSFDPVKSFFHNIERFAFYEDLKNMISERGTTFDRLLTNGELAAAVDCLLSERGLSYSSLPKALLKFHHYPDGSRVAFEEHLVEAAHYASDHAGLAHIHFTLSPEHIERFITRLKQVQKNYEETFDLKYEIGFSVQEKSTDTIAVDLNNEPFRNPFGELLFRPGGHGALLKNLNELDADVIFIKNIDNIVPDRLKGPTTEYKKLIGGYLLYLRGYIFDFLRKADAEYISAEDLLQMTEFLRRYLYITIPQEFQQKSFEEKKKYLVQFVNRPIRVCGMVKNEGEPGGGPFWVREKDGCSTLQIVESSQVDPHNEDQQNILHHSTHFNPVDLICSTRNYKGQTFDLEKFVDPDTGFIATKSSGGKVIKAQELPGLWNGAMAKWITVFMDVPIITFNPVKTVNDLLRKEHQP